MTFDEILEQVRDLLRSKGRVSYRALKRRFPLDDEYLEDLKAEIIKAEQLAIDEDGEVLVWTGDKAVARPRLAVGSPQSPAPSPQPLDSGLRTPDAGPLRISPRAFGHETPV